MQREKILQNLNAACESVLADIENPEVRELLEVYHRHMTDYIASQLCELNERQTEAERRVDEQHEAIVEQRQRINALEVEQLLAEMHCPNCGFGS